MGTDLVAFVQQIDRCWIERRFDDLASLVDSDVVMVAFGGRQRMRGLGAAVASYREFMDRCRVRKFETLNHVVTERGPAAVVEYDWMIGWDEGDARHEAAGREILALVQRDGAWRVIWRTPFRWRRHADDPTMRDRSAAPPTRRAWWSRVTRRSG